MAKNFIREAIKHPGALRKSLHIKENHTISQEKLKKAEHSKSTLLRKRANLAETLKRLRSHK